MKATGSPLILAFDTSDHHCSAVVLAGGEVIAARHETMAKGQAERLFPMLDEVLAEAGVAYGDLDALGVGIGPGNFTGIRISVSAARGLALSLEVPAVGVSLFDALALTAPEAPLLLSLSAARDRVYLQTRDGDQTGEITVAQLDDLPDVADGTVCIGVHSDEIAARLHCKAHPAEVAPAVAVGRLAAERWKVPQERPAPLYIRAADAMPPSDPPPVILP